MNHTTRWVDILSKLIDKINHTKSRVTGMRPVDVNHKNAEEVRQRVYGKVLEAQKQSKYDTGDTVRVAKQRTAFDKFYLPNYTDNEFKVDSVVKGRPNTYTIKTPHGEPIQGKFYTQELTQTRANRDKALVISKVHKMRKRGKIYEFLVSFKGKPEDEASWITKTDLIPEDKNIYKDI